MSELEWGIKEYGKGSVQIFINVVNWINFVCDKNSSIFFHYKQDKKLA